MMNTEWQAPRPRGARRRTTHTTAALALAFFASEAALAADPVLLEGPNQFRWVEEMTLNGSVIQSVSSITSPGTSPVPADSLQIKLGPASPRHIAEAYSTFNTLTQTSTYWASVNDYPGQAGAAPGARGDNGPSSAEVIQDWYMRKDAADATVTLHVTGGRLRLFDLGLPADQVAQVGLNWRVDTKSVNVSSGAHNALLAGRSGVIGGSETFQFVSSGFLLNPDSYKENTLFPGSLNVVEAILDIPAQDIEVDISSIIPYNEISGSDGEFSIHISLFGEALSLFSEGSAAQAFLRDPVSMGQTDPTLGGSGISYTGVTLLAPAPVPEPSTWAFFLAGCGMLAWATRARRRAVDSKPVHPLQEATT